MAMTQGGWPPVAFQPCGSSGLPFLSSPDALLLLFLLNGTSAGSDVIVPESDVGSVLFDFDLGQQSNPGPQCYHLSNGDINGASLLGPL